MRFEYLIGLAHLIIWSLYAVRNRLSFIEWIVVLLITMYGPLYAQLKLGLFNLSFAAAILLIILTTFKSNKFPRYFLYVLPFFLVQIGLFVHEQISLTSFLKGILSLILAFSALLTGRLFARSNLERWLFLLTVSTAIVAVFTVLFRFMMAETMRDAGISFFILTMVLFALIKKRLSYAALLVGYLLAIQTRSLLLILGLIVFLARGILFRAYGKISFTIVVLLLIIFSGRIIYQRSVVSSSDEIELSTMVTRINAIKKEYSDFLSSPWIGKGLYYYQEEWTELQNDQISGKSGVEEYIAFNHVGILSTAAQTGLMGLVGLILLPYMLYLKTSEKVNNLNVFIIRLGLLSFLASFLASGSPLRTDFLDMFYFYFLISILYELNLKSTLSKNCLVH